MVKIPEEHDLVSVTVKHVEYYGYISKIDWDMRCPSIIVEFFPGYEIEFDFNDVKFMDFPKEKT